MNTRLPHRTAGLLAAAALALSLPRAALAKAPANEAAGHAAAAPGQIRESQFWRPEQLNLSPLRDHDARSNPLGADFDYPALAAKLDCRPT